MRRFLVWAAAALVLLAGVGAVYVYQRIVSFDVVRLTDDVHVVYGTAGNVAILRTAQGAVVVDTMAFRLQGRRLLELSERLGGGPPQAIINTHYHWDHTHGNPAFPSGTQAVATRRTREHLLENDAEAWQGAAAGTLPNETFDADYELRVGGKTIRCRHLGRGHTDGDLVVLFVEDRILHAGDLFFDHLYPRIDLAAGGSARLWGETLDRVLALEFDRVVPGHGSVSDREGLAGFQRFMRELWDVADRAARDGWSLEETLRRAELTEDEGYRVRWIPFVLRADRDFALRQAWREAAAAAAANGAPGREDAS